MVCLLHMFRSFLNSGDRRPCRRSPRVPAAGWRAGLGVAAAFVLLLGVVESTAAEQAPKDHAGVKLSGMTFVSSENGVSEVIVRAAEAYVDPEKNVVFLQGMDVTTTSSQGGEVEFEMSCDEGELDLETNDFIARGDVRGKTIDGRRFSTEWARYEEDRALVSTDAPVVLVEEGGTLRGGGFKYWVAEGRLKLTGGATMIQGAVE